MKNILFVFLLLSTALFAQRTDKKWDEVVAYENDGKVKSANEIVSKIYKKALARKDEVQMLKCFFYQSKYLQIIDENAQTKILNNLKTDIDRVSIPSKAILNLIYAKCLNDYYNQNKYSIQRRTNTTVPDTNFLTWTTLHFTDQINLSLKQSLENETVLKNTLLAKYDLIFDYPTLGNFKNQSLYDYIINENIIIYNSKINNWEIQKSDFESYEKVLFGNSVDFIKLNLDFITNENLRQSLSLYQRRESTNPTKENEWDRIQFCKTKLSLPNDSYFNYLVQFQKDIKDELLIQKIQLEKAFILSSQASKDIHPDYNIKAIMTLDSILKISNRSNAYKLAHQKKENIISKSLNVQLQKYTYTDENTRAFIRYKNVDHLTISFFKINQKQLTEFRTLYSKKDSLTKAIIKKAQPILRKNYPLTNKKDFFEYTTEVLLPNLKTGSYLVYFESDSDEKNKKAFAYETITTTNIMALASQGDAKETYQVLDRKTGKPIPNAILKSTYLNLVTNKKGIAVYKEKKYTYNNEAIQISTANDTVSVYKNYIFYSSEYDPTDTTDNNDFKGKVEFYLDRAIYRPGQTVYYKGIAIQKKQNITSIVPHTSFSISIEDPDYNEIKEFEVVTNEFGSFSGEFVLPKTGLTGNFTMKADDVNDYEKDIIYDKENGDHPFWDHVNFENSQTDFRVEEYKRPKFEVTFEPKKETFQINQSIQVKGSAKAFAGSMISDAKVTYSVTRYVDYYRNHYSNELTETISTGETKTDASGKFIIDFVAIPSKNSNKEQLPVFNYRIKASVTDINGETHEVETTVKVGYHDLVLQTFIAPEIRTKDKNEVKLESTNLNGEFLAAKGEVKIYFISPFSSKFKQSVWSKPEIETISNEEFEKLFPYEQNKSDITNEKTEVLVYSKKVDTEKDKKIVLDFITNYKSGKYKIVFSAKDRYNNTIESIAPFDIKQSKDRFNPSKLFTFEQVNRDAKKDGFALIKLTSVIPELYIIATGSYNSKIFFEETYHLQNNETIIKIPLKNEFEKTIKIGFQSVFENETFSNQIDVTLKEPISKLEFNVETFRNKIQPGNSENWSFKLKSINAKKEAEILASMYDSSLDQFTQKDWSNLGIYDYNYNQNNTKTALGFEKTSTSIINLNPPLNRVELYNETTKLIWFGFDFANQNNNLQLQREYQRQLSKKTKKPLNAKMISGVITEISGLPLPGVSIMINGTKRIAQSDFDGYYEIEAAENEEIVFSYLGFQNKTVFVENKKNIDIILIEDSSALSEVVVTAYGIQKKQKSLSYAVRKVSAESISEGAAVNGAPATMLSGIVSGLEITKTDSDTIVIRGTASNTATQPIIIVDGEISNEEALKNLSPSEIISIDTLKADKASALYGSKGANGAIIITTKKALEALTQVKARKNLSETAFFLPNLRTDANGKVSFNFSSPEALTTWKLRLLAHNKDAVSGYLEKSVVTQKELMLLPNFPRFFREKDTVVIHAKISNITNEAKTGIAVLQFFDAATLQPIDAKMLNAKNIRNFTVGAFGNTTVTWTVSIPEGLQGLQYKILAKSGNFSDGEENILPVLTNNMLVTESIPIWVRENSTKEYTFNNLKSNNSTTLKNHQFTFEYTSNPSWIAIQSLPYLMEYEHECAEQTFARFYANALASEIISNNPKIATVFENWRKNGKLTSKLEENEELKSIILAETPWLNDAQSEDEKKKNLALLFDLEKMKTSQETTFEKLKQKQKSSGGFSWFEGGNENEYITRHILAGLGHLSKLTKSSDNNKIDQIAKTGIPFLDTKFLEYYKNKTKGLKAAEKLIWINPYSDLHYLYTRSFYLEKYPLSDTLKKATKLYLETAKKDWLNYSLYEKGLAALTLNRFGEKETAKKIIESLKETSSNNEDLGMYWIANKSGWYWYQAPIETQALLIEAFDEVNNDTKSVDAMKVWLLKNKQTKNWPTTKSTTEAIYALLMQGNDWLSVKDNTVIKIGDEKILTKKLTENEKEAETGYIKLSWKADEIKKEMASISIQNKSKVPGFGGVYWQYFEDLDKIQTNSGSVLSVSKELYLKKSTLKGEQLEKISSKNSLKTGDLVTVRLIITAKEDTEYIHLKDMRASCFEPVNVLSQYQYKDYLGYYMSTKDAATHFFFDAINKGTYVIEYDIRVNNSGEFSNGITTIESMYAPEFTSHTDGIRVKVN
ncbi:MG2 domain-containing protein [Flavobacterium sp. N502536]|uniref:alpha-2-macroglobulin family protein n=1 Tax=Flavobacterium sp. N502536 TaxID=2986837 RepID=UPI002222D22E|nr:MG2 domain-containing protein [Flavobacterium sp. N502536]